jgi:protein O-GlcNAc transferase
MPPAPAARGNRRKLRVGYVSPDFRRHSVSYFLTPLLAAHDRNAVEITCYAEVKQPDEVTARLKGLVSAWRSTVGMSDAELAERIRADGIDILVDLAGHTAGNRLAVFARQPAPVQVTWLGYPNTTGLSRIHYRLVDRVTDPPDASPASERLVRLENGFLCYEPPADAPPPMPPPCLAASAVTFGSFNNAAKLSPATLDAWARILQGSPGSRLVLKGAAFSEAETCKRFRGEFVRRGVAEERLALAPFTPSSRAHLAAYHAIDLALDPFPYNGTTTTCEALWMGVPVIALLGDRHSARVGASILTRLGLGRLIAFDPADYVERALALASDRAGLGELRAGMRQRFAASPLCDAAGFARRVEAAYRRMWEDAEARASLTRP